MGEQDRVKVCDVVAVGTPYIELDFIKNESDMVEKLSKQIGKSLYYATLMRYWQGSLDDVTKTFFDNLKRIGRYSHLNQSQQFELLRLSTDYKNYFTVLLQENDIPVEKLTVKPNGSTFAFVNGKVFYTPIDLVFGDLHSEAKQLVGDFHMEIKEVLGNTVEMSRKEFNLDDDYIDTLAVITRCNFNRGKEREPAFGMVSFIGEATNHYCNTFELIGVQEIVGVVILREWFFEKEEELPVETATIRNVLELTEAAARQVFIKHRTEIWRKYKYINSDIKNVLSVVETIGKSTKPPKRPKRS